MSVWRTLAEEVPGQTGHTRLGGEDRGHRLRRLPQFVWVAVGGKSQLGDKVEVLRGRTVIAFPDVGGYGNVVEKVREKPHLNIHVSDYVNRYAEANGLDSGADVADVLIHWLRNRGSPMKPQQQPSSAELSNPDHPVLQEVLSHISLQYRAEVAALIDDLGLEVVGRDEKNASILTNIRDSI